MNMNFGSLNKEPDQRFPSDQRYTNYNEERAASSRLQPRDASIEPPGETFTVGQADVLCGRGRLSFNNPGNKRFRKLVSAAVDSYDNAGSRVEKSTVVNAIVEEIHSAGGRFLRRDEDTGQWHALDYAQCREKVGHAIRDATSTTGARKKRKHQNRTFGKDVGSAIAGREGFSVHKDWDNPADSSAAKGAKDNDSVRGSISNIVWHFRNTNSLLAPPGQLSDHSGVLPNPGTLAQTRAEGSPMLQYAPNPAVTWASTRTPATKPDQKQDASADAGEEQDDQFLAYIEQVLGPLSPDAPSHDAIG